MEKDFGREETKIGLRKSLRQVDNSGLSRWHFN